MMKRFFAIILCLTLLMAGCEKGGETDKDPSGTTVDSYGAPNTPVTGEVSADMINADDVFSKRDLSGEYDEDEATEIALSGDGLTITEGGVYILRGTLSDGQIVVETDKNSKVQLVFAGVNITREGSAALYVRSADKVFVTLAEGTENTLISKGEFSTGGDVNINGAIFSRVDITINGKGALTVESTDHGIVSKDDLKITGGRITVTAVSHALSGKDSVSVADGEIVLTAGKDGIHSVNDDAARGNILIAGGSIIVTADGDGVDASHIAEIDGGELSIISGGGSANGADHKDDDMWGGFGGWGRDSSSASLDSVSRKGIKADSALYITGGTVKIDAADDALHSNGNVVITGGKIEAATGYDGVHADGGIMIMDGELNITESYEGIEGKTVKIAGGRVSVIASDDGLNASDGTGDVMSGMGRPGGMRVPGEVPGDMGGNAPGGDMPHAPGGGADVADTPGIGTDAYGDIYLLISGGYLYVNAGGDGLDSNSGLYITGGETYIDGPTNSGNGAIDYATEAVISGGTIVAVGAVGMAENFGENSTQGAIMYNVSGSGEIRLLDGDGNVLVSHTPAKSYGSVVISAPGVETGKTYTLEIGGASYEITMTSIIYGTGSGMGGFGGGRPGGGKPGGGRR